MSGGTIIGLASPPQDSDAPTPLDTQTDGRTVEFVLRTIDYALQPIVDFGTGVVYGYEALIRNLEPLDLQSPHQLLDHAFENGYLKDLEPQLLSRAIEKFSELRMARGTKLFFNIDGRGLGQDNDPRLLIADVAEKCGLSPGQICLELSARHQTDNSDVADHALNDLRQSGLKLALDDFGRGFSELRMLHDMSPDYVKIDRFFLVGIDSDPRRKLFVTTVVNLAHVLGAKVVAEGVETEKEYKACWDAGCDLVQGFFVARPFQSTSKAKLFYNHIGTRSLGNQNEKDDHRIRDELQNLPTVTFDAPMRELLDLVRSDPEANVVPVLDSNNEPCGLIHERDLKAYLYAGGSEDEDYNAALDFPLRGFVRSCPIANIDTNSDMLLVTFASSLNSDGILITQDFRYVGFLSATSLLKIIHEKRLQEAQDQNPLTRLPGNGAVNCFITEAARSHSATRHLCYFDFDNFKPFNDSYGYRQGDRALILFSELLQRHVTGPDSFFGHIGGDDFFAGFLSGDQTEIATKMLTLKRAFKTDVESFYNSEDRARGYIRATDRFGSNRQFSLLDCSISIVSVPPDMTLRPEQLNEEIASLKRAAKRSDDGFVVKTLGAQGSDGSLRT